MCLAIPMRIISKDETRATVSLGETTQQVDISLTPNANIGDYVIVHAGYAIETMNEEEAKKTIDLIREVASHEVS